MSFRMLCLALAIPALLAAQRTAVSLDGAWEVADSVAAAPAPASFTHKAPVPGLANLATPAFPDVDKFDSRELIGGQRTAAVGVARQNRNYFWYRRTFRVPARRAAAILRINKAQFGTAVWLNGKSVGEHAGCFSAAVFDATPFLKWDGENELIVRIGAHPAAMPAWAPAGTDQEKYRWTPGIYDSVSLALSDNPVIETVQVAPRVPSSEILVETIVRNAGSAPASFSLRQAVHGWKESARVAFAAQQVRLAPGERRAIRTTLKIPNVRLWTPETPNLYVLETATGGDSASTRFGMREFRFDTATRRAYLNGRLYFLRGSNITLHRFFEDPECKDRPWDEAWVRKLLIDIPKRMHWNSFRFCIGPVPQFWFDIADEAGLLIQNEFPIWHGHWDEWRTEELITEYSEWMRDNWNHPSVAIWDACNETRAEILRDKVIPAVRSLDLSNRPWDNGYTLPAGPDDPVEDHPYLFMQWQRSNWNRPGRKAFEITDLETMVGEKTNWNSPHPTSHAAIVNEYGWLWLRRDGQPTTLTDKVYERLAGADATPEQRFEEGMYYVAGLTEFWRAHRNFAGVLHFVYLTCSYPGVKTSDNFRDVAKLELEPHFADYVGEAFRPVGVYINFWQPKLKPGSERDYAVMIVNDEPEPREGKITLSFEATAKTAAQVEAAFRLPAYGQQTWPLRLETPKQPGRYLLKAVATYGAAARTISRRKVEVQ